MTIKVDPIKVIAFVEFLLLCFTTYDNFSVRRSRSALELKINYSNYMDKAWDVHSSFKDESQKIDKDIGSQTDSLLRLDIGLTLLFDEICSLNQLWETRHLRLIEKAGDKIRAYEQVIDSSFKATKAIEETISFLVPPIARAEKAYTQRLLELERITGFPRLLPTFPPHGSTLTINGSGTAVAIQTQEIKELLKNRSDSLEIVVGEFHLVSTKTMDTLRNAWLTY